MVPMSSCGGFPPPSPAPGTALRPPSLSKRIELIADSIEPLISALRSEAFRIDSPGHWTAAVVADNALTRAQSELRIASLSLGIQEDVEIGGPR